MRNVYGKKARNALQSDFFAGTPEQPRRSPRLRKVLGERSANVQLLDDTPVLPPSCTKSISSAVVSVTSCEDPESSPEPVKKPARRRRGGRDTDKIEDEATDALAKALGLLDLTESELKIPTSSSSEPSSQSTDTESSISSQLSTPPEPASQPVLIPQCPAKLKPDILSYVSPLLECKNVSKVVESFAGWTEARQDVLTFAKIGEGSYGQVFRATDAHGATVIIKLMPLNAARGRRWQQFTAVPAAATEVQLLARMQKVPGYVEFRGACVLAGAMPELFMDMWEQYRDSGRTVESRDPRIKGTYPSTQLWLMLEMSDAGTNLEPGRYLPPEASAKLQKRGKYLPVARVWDVFWQVVLAVAKAEAYCRFEHRDLHLGNICVRDSGRSLEEIAASGSDNGRRRNALTAAATLPFPVDATTTVITIIDYTLSRADTTTSTSSDGNAVAFDFQADAVLLGGEGDLQYDMYRWMDEIIGDRGCRTYDPRTNAVWFYHLLVKLLDMMIPLAGGGEADEKPASNSSSSSSASSDAASDGDLGEDSECFRSESREQAQLRILREVCAMLDPKVIRTWIANSAGDLLQHAFAKDWIVADSV